MNTITKKAVARVGAARPRPAWWKPRRWGSPELASAIGALAAYIRHLPDATLEDVRFALQGTGFRWSGAGDLTFSTQRAALIDELDELIDAFGRDAPAAGLFPQARRIGIVKPPQHHRDALRAP